jgi:hypothetical protein
MTGTLGAAHRHTPSEGGLETCYLRFVHEPFSISVRCALVARCDQYANVSRSQTTSIPRQDETLAKRRCPLPRNIPCTNLNLAPLQPEPATVFIPTKRRRRLWGTRHPSIICKKAFDRMRCFSDNIHDSKDFEKQSFDVWDLLPALDECRDTDPVSLRT